MLVYSLNNERANERVNRSGFALCFVKWKFFFIPHSNRTIILKNFSLFQFCRNKGLSVCFDGSKFRKQGLNSR